MSEELTIQQMKNHLAKSGINMDNLPKDTIDKVMQLASTISDPESSTGLDFNALQKLITPPKQQKKTKKIKPNVKCPCGSDIKYKKCCGKN